MRIIKINGVFVSRAEYSDGTISASVELDFDYLLEQLEKQGISIKRPYVLEFES